MSGKEKFCGLGRSATAGQKRNQQLEQWEKSVTNKEPAYVSSKRKNPRVRFGESVVFLAASQSGDVEEVERLLTEEGADVNSVNKDGLTALHQPVCCHGIRAYIHSGLICCIDDDFEMVQLLVRRGASLDVQDNEGWTPLHAATSCGHDHIVSHLLDNGAFPAPVNNEGDTPDDLADNDVIRELITEAILKQGVSVTDAKTKEESLMLADANRLKNDPSLTPAVSPGGASVLHVAAAKNYLEVIEVLLSIPSIVNNIDCRDEDGWTALHAAVYWESMEAAKMLVKKGASVNVVTKTGDTIDDLCRPEYDDELEELKQLCESTTRNRCYAMHHKRPSLLHQSSREDMNGIKPSPTGLRRRSSRDRAMFPKIDIASEKAIIENWTPEEVADGNREGGGAPSQEIEVFEETKNIGQEAHTDNNVKEAVNSLKERDMVVEETNQVAMPTSKPPLPPGTSPQSSPRVQPKAEPTPANSKTTSPKPSSPKTMNKRRPMSGQMMKRVTLWEQQSSTNLNPPPPAGPSPSGSASSSPQHSTPRDPAQAPPDVAKALQGVGGEPKRFPFISKTISQDAGEARLKPLSHAGGKRNSYDEARLVRSLRPEETTPSRTASLPRNARIVMEHSLTPPSGSVAINADVAAMTTKAMPTQSVPTEGDVSRGDEGAKVDARRELSRGESEESLRSDRSFTEESETNRKRKAKKTRETRKKTQPVPSDLFEKLSQLDKKDMAEKERGEGGKGEGGKGEVGKEQGGKGEMGKEQGGKEQGRKEQVGKEQGGKEQGGKVEEDIVREQVERERKEFVEQLRTSAKDTTPASTADSKQSAYRPSARPAPRFRPHEATPPQTLAVPGAEERAQLTPVDREGELGDSRDMEEEGSGKQRSRTKSAVRRKPREQRKLTGIVVDPDELKNAPEEVARLFQKSGSASTSGPESTPNTLSGLQEELKGVKESYSKANEELKRVKESYNKANEELKGIKESYSKANEELKGVKGSYSKANEELKGVKESYSKANEEIASLKAKVSELYRRLEDATRAYQQEKREKEEREQRITELETETKSRDELKVENQRLKDENSALIRVIGKLSRAPIRPA